MNMIEAIQFYEGDIKKENLRHPFLRDSKAYVTINSLFFDGHEIEKMRIKEGKLLNPEIVNRKYFSILKSVIQNLILAGKQEHQHEFCTTRVERYVDYLPLVEKKETISFTSTSKGPFLESYMNKEDLVLMTFHIGKNASYIDFEEVLKEDYLKKDEREVLLLPGLPLTFKQRELTQEELLFKDIHGNPPKLAVDVYVDSPTRYELQAQDLHFNFELEYVYQQMILLNHHEKLDDPILYDLAKKSIIASMII